MVSINKPAKLTLSLDFRLLSIALLVVIVGMLAVWRPWQQTNSNRTVQVTGEAKLKADPDEFVFYPNYQFTNADKTAALKALTAKSNEVVGKLKELGVPENKIQVNSSGSDQKLYYPTDDTTDPTYVLAFTITVGSKDGAQKVSDYLNTTGLLGSVSPQPGFSDGKRKELEKQARDLAVADAREKAEQNVRNIDAKLGKVKDVTDGQGFGGGPVPYSGVTSIARDTAGGDEVSLGILPGESEVLYTVTVTYFVR